jgi:hypothetical protein
MKITTKVCGFASHERMRGGNRTVLVLGMEEAAKKAGGFYAI